MLLGSIVKAHHLVSIGEGDVRRAGSLLLAVGLVAACGSGDSRETTTTAVATTSTSQAASTTSTSTTTTTLPSTTTTTTSTIPLTPAELRSEFVAELDAAGWVEYTDSVIGWSIRYPSEWEVVFDEPGDTFGVAAAGGGLLLISAARDATGDDGSADYLEGNIEFSVDDGLLNPADESAWFWLDHDFDNVEGPLDISGVETSLAVDPLTGQAIPENQEAPTWWYGYYNPDLRPDYGYILQTLGTNPALFDVVDSVVLSFVPPEE